jgi:hypothetical protein
MHLLLVAFLPLLLAAGCAAMVPDAPVASRPEAVATQPATPQHAAKPSASTTPQTVPAATPVPAVTKPVTPSPTSPAAKPAPPPTAAVSASIAPPALDLNALKEQLKETKAIGVFTKVSLKNQVDDLLQQFRDYYQGKSKVTMAQLRRSYDLLLMKVLSLLQDADQKLAAAIVSSRETIWGLLADPKKFATLKG